MAAAGESWRDKKLALVFGMLKTHDAAGFLTPLAPHVAALEAIAIPGEENSLSAEDAAAAARTVGLPARAHSSIETAVAAAAAPRTRVLICGSLYLAGRVLAAAGALH